VSLALEDRPRALELTGSGGGPARRAIFRWSWRLFRREWRRQMLVLALIVFAVAATTVGVALAYNAGDRLDSRMGTATGEMTFSGADRADVAAAQRAFGTIEEIDHQSIPIPGSLNAVDLRAEDPNGTYAHPTLRVVAGRFPTGPTDIALTRDAAAAFNVKIGDSFVANGLMCMRNGLAYSIPTAFLFWMVLRRGAILFPKLVGAAAGGFAVGKTLPSFAPAVLQSSSPCRERLRALLKLALFPWPRGWQPAGRPLGFLIRSSMWIPKEQGTRPSTTATSNMLIP